jgi:hypothetical protein
VTGYSRDSFYRSKKSHESGGETALMELSWRQPNLKKRIATEIEDRVGSVAVDELA